MTAGIYAIQLSGTPFVWVGESANIEKRFAAHAAEWAWPNEVIYYVVRAMPGSTRKGRQYSETALMRLLRHRGSMMLSPSRAEVGARNIAVWNAHLTPDERRALARLASAAMNRSHSLRSDHAKKANARRRLRGRSRTAFTLATNQQRREWGRLGALARWGERKEG